MLKIIFKRILISIIIVFIFSLHILGIYKFSFLESLDLFFYDLKIRQTVQSTIDYRIVIIDIDEKSLAREGHWPWKRDKIANLVCNLFDFYNISTLGFDIVFAEKDDSSDIKLFNKITSGNFTFDKNLSEFLKEIRPSLDRDKILADSFKEKPIVLGYYFKPYKNSNNPGMLPDPLNTENRIDISKIPVKKAEGFEANLSILQQNALSGGFFDNPLIDKDGIFRQIPLLEKYQNKLYESFALAMIRTILGINPYEPVSFYTSENNDSIILEEINTGGLRIPTNKHGAVLIPYLGKQGSFPYISATDILTKKADQNLLTGTIAIIGATVPGLSDLRSTPVQNVFPGVEIQANLISGFLDQRIKHQPEYTKGIEFFSLAFLGILLSFALPRMSPVISILFFIITISSITLLNFYLFTQSNLVIPIASSLILVLCVFIFHITYGYVVESKEKRKVASIFGKYIPPELVKEISSNPENYNLETKLRNMTVIFADIRGFTSISETLDPKDLGNLINEFLTAMTKIIYANRGTIDKYIGDAIMAFWGAPVTNPDHKKDALFAALEMIKALDKLKSDFKKKRWPELKIGIGINTGPMNVGNMGSVFRIAYTVLGDAVNLSSRLESLTSKYGVNIIVSKNTMENIDEIVFREIDIVKVKGKKIPVSIYEPLGFHTEINEKTETEVKIFDKALTFYRQQNWIQAEKTLLNLKKISKNQILCDLYMDRIKYFCENPPKKEWDGVFTFNVK